MGVASWRWVRPVLTTPWNSTAFAASASWSAWSPGRRSSSIATAAASWSAVGMLSFEDWPALTWSFWWTLEPSLSDARWAMTSFAFMFVEVPEPVW